MYYASARLTMLFVVLVGLVACGDREDSPAPGANSQRATEASGFEVETFEGQTFSLGEQRGTPVVLNFWESW